MAPHHSKTVNFEMNMDINEDCYDDLQKKYEVKGRLFPFIWGHIGFSLGTYGLN